MSSAPFFVLEPTPKISRLMTMTYNQIATKLTLARKEHSL